MKEWKKRGRFRHRSLFPSSLSLSLWEEVSLWESFSSLRNFLSICKSWVLEAFFFSKKKKRKIGERREEDRLRSGKGRNGKGERENEWKREGRERKDDCRREETGWVFWSPFPLSSLSRNRLRKWKEEKRAPFSFFAFLPFLSHHYLKFLSFQLKVHIWKRWELPEAI